MDHPTATEVLRAMVAMFTSGDPSKAATIVAEDYLDHQASAQVRCVASTASRPSSLRTSPRTKTRTFRLRTYLAWRTVQSPESVGVVIEGPARTSIARPSPLSA
jgi:hypothetical protein